MKHTFHIETLGNLLVIRFTSVCTVESLTMAIDSIASYPGHYSRLWDFSTGIDLPNQQLKEIAHYVRKKLDYPARVAVVAPADLTFGLMRMYEVYREDKGLEFRVFREEASALTWLRSTPAENHLE